MEVEGKRGTVFIDEEKDKLYKDLSATPQAPFETGKDVLIAAACLGYRNNKRVRLRKKRELFKWGTFQPEDITAIRAIALVASKAENILTNQDSVLTILEEYANGGIEYLHQALMQGGTPLLNLVSLVLEGEGDKGEIM